MIKSPKIYFIDTGLAARVHAAFMAALSAAYAGVLTAEELISEIP
jgi:predicted AAA+ superfamily ATPase